MKKLRRLRKNNLTDTKTYVYNCMARPPIHQDPVKLTLYVERHIRDLLQVIAKKEHRSGSSIFSELVVREYGERKEKT